MWVGLKGILGKHAGEADAGIATLRAQDGIMVFVVRRGKEKY